MACSNGLIEGTYRGHPIVNLFVWATDASTATYRGDGKLALGSVKLLLDGQQRMTIKRRQPSIETPQANAVTPVTAVNTVLVVTISPLNVAAR